MRDDLTLVVSPLVSLMQDQVTALREVAPGRVELVNAQQGGAANREALARAAAGEVRLLYVAPERFASPRFADFVGQIQVGLFVVDEAHCISQWGHDFRPDYFFLADAARRVGAQATMGLTATATPAVADDIARRLALRDPVRVTTGFDRPNLSFAVVRCADRGRQAPAACGGAMRAGFAARDRVRRDPPRQRGGGGGSLPRALGEEVPAYHAGLRREVRAATQERFMSGEVRVIVATNAFGMGIDKANVRTVCHATVPGSLEAYYQEAGRAGRDGAPARCLLFAEQRDKGLHVFFIQRSRLDAGVFERVAERLRWAGLDGRYDVAVGELAAEVGSGGDSPGKASGRSSGIWCARGWSRPSRPRRTGPPVLVVGSGTGARSRVPRFRAGCRARALGAVPLVWGYVEGSSCRRAALLAHFGDRSRAAPSVACCDVCSPAVAPRRPRPAGAPPPPGDRCPGSATSRGIVGAGNLDDAILDVVVSAAPRSAARARSRSSGAVARRSSPSTRTTGSRPTARSPTCARARSSAGSISFSRPARSAPRAAGFRSCAPHERRRARLGRRHQPPGAARPGPRPRRREDRGGRVR